MKYKVEKQKGRYALYIWRNGSWVLHKTYATERGAETAAMILYDRKECAD